MTTASDSRVAPDELADLYRGHDRQLQRAVARAVSAPRELIEDACQNAWTIMLRSRPRRDTWFAWLRVVAVHEAYRLCEADRVAYLEDLDQAEGWEAVTPDRHTLENAIEARRALRRLAELPGRERRNLTLKVAGFSYVEIAEMTGGLTYRAQERARDGDGRPTFPRVVRARRAG